MIIIMDLVVVYISILFYKSYISILYECIKYNALSQNSQTNNLGYIDYLKT